MKYTQLVFSNKHHMLYACRFCKPPDGILLLCKPFLSSSIFDPQLDDLLIHHLQQDVDSHPVNFATSGTLFREFLGFCGVKSNAQLLKQTVSYELIDRDGIINLTRLVPYMRGSLQPDKTSSVIYCDKQGNRPHSISSLILQSVNNVC